MEALNLDCPICRQPAKLDLSESLGQMLDRCEKEIIVEMMRLCYNNRSEAARRLGIEVYALRHLQMKHGLIPPKPKKKSYPT